MTVSSIRFGVSRYAFLAGPAGRWVRGLAERWLARRRLYRERDDALAQMLRHDAATLARVGLTHHDLHWEARLPLKQRTAENLARWRRLGLIS